MTFDFAPYHDSIDLVNVDASHTHEFVFNDSLKAFRMVRPGGVILWHDYESVRSDCGVTWFVERLRARHRSPLYRLSSELGDTRYAVLRVDPEIKNRLNALAASPESF